MTEQTSQRRKGRGYLSSIEMLPEEADEDVMWADAQLRDRKLPQSTILMEFNERLADKGIGAISKGAFSRYSVRRAIAFRKTDHVQRISHEVVSNLGTDKTDNVTVMVAELIKLRLFELLEEGKLDPKETLAAARALASSSQAQKTSEGNRQQRTERERRDKELANAVNKAVDEAEVLVREAGLSPDRIEQLRRDFLGVRTGKAPSSGSEEQS